MKKNINTSLTLLVALLVFATTSFSQNVSFELLQKYHHNSPDWDYALNEVSVLSTSASLGDLDKDGNNDILLAAYGEGAASTSGEVLVAFLKSDGSIREIVKIASGVNGFNQSLAQGSTESIGARFGVSLVTVGDINDDGIQDIAIGASTDYADMVNKRCGSVYILMMNEDGTVKNHQRLGEGEGNFQGWGPQAYLGSALAAIGDVDNDGIPDLAIGSQSDRELGPSGGAVFIAYLNRDGTVKSQKKITPTGSFFNDYSLGDKFGHSLNNVGDINGDGNFDLLVGTYTGGKSYLIFLDENQEVIGTKVYDLNEFLSQSIFKDPIYEAQNVSSIPDINYDGRNEILITPHKTHSGYGEVGLFFLDEEGDITGYKILNKEIEGLGLIKDELFGSRLSYLGDLNKDGFPEIGVGSIHHSGEIEKGGAVYTISVIPGPCVDDECLWPGDCNNDGFVDCKDLIPIGSAFLDSNLNTRRILPSTEWIVQYASNWQDKKWQVDKKLADCNGDGIINIHDRDAIYVNYGFSQQKMFEDPDLDPNGPLLNLVAIEDSIAAGDTAKFDLYFGESIKKAENIYGISLSLGHEVAELNGLTKNTAKFPVSWFGEDGEDMITLSKETPDGIDISLVRTDKQNRTGYGRIASIDIIAPDNLGEMFQKALKLKLKDVLIVSYQEDTIAPDFVSESTGFKVPLSVKSVYNSLNFYPNPVKTVLNIQVSEKIETLTVVDIHGRELVKTFPNSSSFSVNISHLSEGNYFLVSESASSKYVTRITKR